MTVLSENDDHCHQRPECKQCGLLKSTVLATGQLCVSPSTTNIPPHDFGESHQRPQSDWEIEFREFWNEHDGDHFYRDEFEAFIAHLLKDEYERGQQDANTRLLENNRTLQTKLREGNRAILEECIKLSAKVRQDAHCCEHIPCIDCASLTLTDYVDNLRVLLSFQQEPQDGETL